MRRIRPSLPLQLSQEQGEENLWRKEVPGGKKWGLPLVWVMDCLSVKEVTTIHCALIHYKAYVHDLCTKSDSKADDVLKATLGNPAGVCGEYPPKT